MQHLVDLQRSSSLVNVLTPASEFHRLVLINSGGFYFQTQHDLTLAEGDLLLLPAGQIFEVSDQCPGDFRILNFCGNCLDLSQNHSLLAPYRLARFSKHKKIHCDIDQCSWINKLFDQLERYRSKAFAAQYDILKSYLLLILHEVSLHYPIEKARPRSIQVELALEYIEEQYHLPISLEDVAKQVNWSRPYLANKIKSETGRSVGEWLQTFRMNDAASRLIHSQKLVAGIAEAVGYPDVTHFIRHFKRYHGKTPATWRREYQEESGLTFEFSLNTRH